MYRCRCINGRVNEVAFKMRSFLLDFVTEKGKILEYLKNIWSGNVVAEPIFLEELSSMHSEVCANRIIVCF